MSHRHCYRSWVAGRGLAKPLARALAAGLALVALPFFAASAHATVAVALSLDGLVQGADRVVVADVVSSEAAWDARHETIVTSIELAVVESWKGDATPAKHITFRQPGGTVGDITMTVAGLSSFTPGERSLLFLRKAGIGWTVVGLSQGKHPMTSLPEAGTPGGRRWMVNPPVLAGLATVKKQNPAAPGNNLTANAPATSTNAADVKGPISLDEMRARVQALIQSGSK